MYHHKNNILHSKKILFNWDAFFEINIYMVNQWVGVAHNKLKLYLVAWWSVPNHINIKIKPI